MKSLILSKEQYIRKLLKDMLSALNIETHESDIVEENLAELLLSIKPDVVFLDINYDTDKHTRLINTIKQYAPNATITVTSTTYNKTAVINALSVGVRYFIMKPFMEEEIEYVINKISKEKCLCLA